MENLIDLTVDAIIVGTILISGILAYLRGFARETLTIIAYLGSAIATYYLFPYTIHLVKGFVHVEELASVITVSVIFISALIIIYFMGYPIARKINLGNAGTLDRALGLGFGLARGGVIIVVLYMLFLLTLAEENMPNFIAEANLFPFVESAGKLFLSLLVSPSIEDRIISEFTSDIITSGFII